MKELNIGIKISIHRMLDMWISVEAKRPAGSRHALETFFLAKIIYGNASTSSLVDKRLVSQMGRLLSI